MLQFSTHVRSSHNSGDAREEDAENNREVHVAAVGSVILAVVRVEILRKRLPGQAGVVEVGSDGPI